MKPIRVVLVEDHALVRAGIRALLENLSGIQVVAEAGNGHDGLLVIAMHQPDVVAMDIAMPGLNGLEVAARVAKDFPQTRVIMLSMHAHEEYVLRALRAGAAGYLLKDAGTTELELAFKVVMQGQVYLSPQVSKYVVSAYIQRTSGEQTSLDRLTPRQREILQLIAEGQTAKEIAYLLNLSVKTVETHRTAIMDRLGIHNIAGLTRYAIRMGLITMEK